MILVLASLLASNSVLPEIDRRTLEMQARAERLQPSRSAAVQPRPLLRPAAMGPLDFTQVTTICRAAGSQRDPASFIAGLASAYRLSPAETASLRTSCAAYIAGREDAQRRAR